MAPFRLQAVIQRVTANVRFPPTADIPGFDPCRTFRAGRALTRSGRSFRMVHNDRLRPVADLRRKASRPRQAFQRTRSHPGAERPLRMESGREAIPTSFGPERPRPAEEQAISVSRLDPVFRRWAPRSPIRRFALLHRGAECQRDAGPPSTFHSCKRNRRPCLVNR